MAYHPLPQATYTDAEAQYLAAQRTAQQMRAAALAQQLAEQERVEAEVQILHFKMLALKAEQLGRKLKKTTTGAYVLSNWSYSKHYAELSDVDKEIKRLEGAT